MSSNIKIKILNIIFFQVVDNFENYGREPSLMLHLKEADDKRLFLIQKIQKIQSIKNYFSTAYSIRPRACAGIIAIPSHLPTRRQRI